MKKIYSILLLFILHTTILFAQKPVKKSTTVPRQEKKDEMPSLNFGIEKEMKQISTMLLPQYKIVNKPIALTESQKKKIKEIDALIDNYKACNTNCHFPFEEFEQKPVEWPKEKMKEIMQNNQKITPGMVTAFFKKDELKGVILLLPYETFVDTKKIVIEKGAPIFIADDEYSPAIGATGLQAYYYFDSGELFYMDKKGEKGYFPDQELTQTKAELKHDIPLLIDAVKKQFLQQVNN